MADAPGDTDEADNPFVKRVGDGWIVTNGKHAPNRREILA
jgi:hypothetical protein